MNFPLPTQYPELGFRHVLVFERSDHDDHTLVATTLDELETEFRKLVTWGTRIYEYLAGDVIPPTPRMASRYAHAEYRSLVESSKYAFLTDIASIVSHGYPAPVGFIPCRHKKSDYCHRCAGSGYTHPGTWQSFVSQHPQVLTLYYSPEVGTVHTPAPTKGKVFALVRDGWKPDRVWNRSDWEYCPQRGTVLFIRDPQTDVPPVFNAIISDCQPPARETVDHDLAAKERATRVFANLREVLEFPPHSP